MALLMQTTFSLLKSAPTPGARIFIDLHGRSAGRTADGRITLVVERVVRDIMLADIFPDLPLGPTGEGINFYETKLSVAFNHPRLSARRGLVATNRSNPGAQSGQHFPERLHFSQAAAEIRIALPEPLAIPERLLFQRSLRSSPFKAHSIARGQLISKLVSLR